MRLVLRTVTLAAAAGLAIGGGFGLLAPTSAEATPHAFAPARPAVVTRVDLLGAARLEVTVRCTNTGTAVERLGAFSVLADGRPLDRRTAPDAVELRPGASAEETVAFAAPALTADLTLTLQGGETLPLEL